jgi:CsoR family transcriptional regulator, copper-sensing transcriptional repressor
MWHRASMAGAAALPSPTPRVRRYDDGMKTDTKKDVAARLRSIGGHLKAVERMVDEDKYCVDVLKQTMAIEKALERVDAMILGSHLETCVADAFREGRAEKTVAELAEIFNTARK